MWINLKGIKKLYFDENFGLGAKFGSGEETDYIFSYLKNKKNIYYYSKVSIYHPKDFLDLDNYSKIYQKFLSYGKGQGAIIKKSFTQNKILFLYLFLYSLLKSLIATVTYVLIFKFNNVIKYFALFIGKIIGFTNYKLN
jgi:hypothetical protein